MICSDFHPFQKVSDVLGLEKQTYVFDDEMAHARFFSEDIRRQMPLRSYRKYNISEIINALWKMDLLLIDLMNIHLGQRQCTRRVYHCRKEELKKYQLSVVFGNERWKLK